MCLFVYILPSELIKTKNIKSTWPTAAARCATSKVNVGLPRGSRPNVLSVWSDIVCIL